jgi:hypothetical protein
MKRVLIKIGLSALLSMFFVSAALENADASFHMRYRSKWRTDYVDGNIGTYLTGTTDVDRSAAYVTYSVYTGSGQTFVTSGWLDASGYTAYFDATNGQHYWLILNTWLQKDGVWIILEAPTWNTTCAESADTSLYYNYFIPSGVPDGSNYTVPNQVFDVGYHAGVAPVAARVLDNATLFDISSSRHIRVVGFNGLASQYQGNNILCIDWYDPGHQYWKWILAHEFGHALSDNMYGVIWRGEQGIAEIDTDTSHYCGANDGAHSLISWERVDGAQSEGFGNYAASVLMFPRTASSPVFGAYEPLTLPSFIPAAVRTAALSPPWSASMTTQYKYMETACNWTMVDHGIEWDWQNFFWQVWATGTNKIEMADMFDIWPTGYPDSTWTNRQWADIDGNADTYLTDLEYGYFGDRAIQNGIDH